MEYFEGRLTGGVAYRLHTWLFGRTCCILNRRIRSRLAARAIDRLLCDEPPVRLKGRCSARFYTISQAECLALELVGNWIQLHRVAQLIVLMEYKQIAPMDA